MKKGNMETTLSDRQLEMELKRTVQQRKHLRSLCRTMSTMIVIAACLVLIAVLWLPVYQITGKTMEPTLKQGEIVVACRIQDFDSGDIAALYYENQILIRRVIGMPGDWIDIDKMGKVSVNGELLAEDYLEATVLGTSDITYPYLVPEDCYFVMGDNREAAADSRMSFIGCIEKEKMAGKVFLRVWPLPQAGYME